MTDKIIKALECCKISDCPNCPYIFNGCIKTLHENIIDTIKNLEAEIERLKDLCREQNTEIMSLNETKHRLLYNLKAVLDERSDNDVF